MVNFIPVNPVPFTKTPAKPGAKQSVKKTYETVDKRDQRVERRVSKDRRKSDDEVMVDSRSGRDRRNRIDYTV